MWRKIIDFIEKECFKMTGMTQKSEGSKSNNLFNLILFIILFVIGIALLANPVGGMQAIVIILGIALIAYGAINIIMDYSRHIKMGSAYVLPVVLLILGILLILFNGPTAGVILPLIVGIWAIIQGAISLSNAFKAKNSGNGWLAKMILAAIILALGIIIIVSMIAGGNAIGAIFGILLIIFSIVGLVQWIAERFSSN